jgi:IS30 family transposase
MLTVDNGKEFAVHAGLLEALAIGIFFTHPYHPWERGFNEHTNGLIRQYLQCPLLPLLKNILTKLSLKSTMGLARF